MDEDYDRDREQREWFKLRYEGLLYEVYAFSPAKAVEYFMLWIKTPVEVNWIRRIIESSSPQTTAER